MPRYWYDRHAISSDLPEDEQRMLRQIVADRKPYFMRYIYPALSRQYNTYVKAANKNALREFGLSIDEMLNMRNIDLSDAQNEFLHRYRKYMPVGTNDCTMNRICRRIEAEFDHCMASRRKDHMFDYRILKANTDYSASHFDAVRNLMYEYNDAVQKLSITSNCDRLNDEEKHEKIKLMDQQFMEKCAKVCPDDEELCDIVLDLCYTKDKTKQFAWKMCGGIIVQNLIKRYRKITFPVKDEEGDIVWKSEKFSIASVAAGVVE